MQTALIYNLFSSRKLLDKRLYTPSKLGTAEEGNCSLVWFTLFMPYLHHEVAKSNDRYTYLFFKMSSALFGLSNKV